MSYLKLKTILLLTASLIIPNKTNAQSSVTLVWSLNPTNQNVTDYQLYITTNLNRLFFVKLLTGNTNTITLDSTNLFRGRTNYYFLSAINSLGLESPLTTNNVSLFVSNVPPSMPLNFRISIVEP